MNSCHPREPSHNAAGAKPKKKINGNKSACDSKVYEQNEQTYTLNDRQSQFEAKIKSQIDKSKIEIQHKFIIHLSMNSI